MKSSQVFDLEMCFCFWYSRFFCGPDYCENRC